MSRNVIQITFNNAIDQARRLESCSDQLRSVQRRITELKGGLQQQWSGEAANLFLQKCDMLLSKVNKTETDLTRIANMIRTSARAYYEAEQEAIRIAQIRGSGGGGGSAW